MAWKRGFEVATDVSQRRHSAPGAPVKVRYYVDAMTGEPHIHNHGVTEAEVEEALARAGEDRPGVDGARVAVGRSSAGRYLRVVYVPEPGGAFVITAYDLRGKALWAYRRRKRRKR